MKKPIAKLESALKIATVVAALSPGVSWAAETTSAIRGKLIGADGSPMINATIVVVDTRTGVSREYQSNDSGSFLANRLPVGGPYKVTVNGKTVTVPAIRLGDIYNLTIDNQSDQPLEEVIVYGDVSKQFDLAAGPSAAFSSYDIETSVAFNNDIKDVYTIDPRIHLDGDGGSVNCAGKHPRFNSLTLDGVSQDDLFGLNNNGYSTAVGQPFPLAAVDQVSVELAPFDVTYGGFTACNINAVTRSGSNEWTGSVSYEYSNQDLRGEKLDGHPDQSRADYDKTRIGFSIGGPIIEDTLFFHATYEENEDPRFLAQGYAGSGNGDERPWLSKAVFDQIVDTAKNVYNYDPGGLPGDGTSEDEKYVIRLDYNITENHTASLIYNYYDGFEDRASDSDSDEFEFANHYYTKGSEQTTWIGKWAAQWTDAFSTELYYSTSEMNDSQVTKGPRDIADFQIDIDGNTVYLGADDSRQANALNYDTKFLRAAGTLLLGDHILTAGYEYSELEIFNLFVQHSRGGEYDFYTDRNFSSNAPACAALTPEQRILDANCGATGLDRFLTGRVSQLYYGSGGGTNNPNDAAASFTNEQHTLYLQDEWYLSNIDLTLVFGLRYEKYESGDTPKFNQNFTNVSGIRNDASIDGIDILMPRFGFTWEALPELTVRGGFGLFSGGNPNVWISNAYSNDGITNVQVRIRNFNGARTVLDPNSIAFIGNGQPGRAVPQELFNQVANTTAAAGSTSGLVLLDPDYEQPSEWKLAIGATYDLPVGDITMDADYLYSRQKDAAIYVDVSQDIVGRTILGQPIYDYVRGRDNFMLTNSSDHGDNHVFSLSFKKDFDWGLDLMLGYAYSKAEDVSPMTSFVAFSNFINNSVHDINDPGVGDSNYGVPHRFTIRASYGKEFFSDLETRVSIFGYASDGQRQNYAMQMGLEGNSRNRRHLLYVPSGATDPNVVFSPGFNQDAFFAFVAREGLDAGFQSRNELDTKWTYRMDLSISQELPTFIDGVKGRAFMKMYNFTNFLNDDWGKINDAQFSTPSVVEGSINGQGQYVFENFSARDIDDLREDRSYWEVRMGVNFKF